MNKFGLTEERYQQMMQTLKHDEEWVEGVVTDWGIENCNKGYAIFNYEGLDLEELCAIHDVGVFESDEEAVVVAKQDGIKIIPKDELPKDMPDGMEYHQWIDTEENRKNLFEYCKKRNSIKR